MYSASVQTILTASSARRIRQPHCQPHRHKAGRFTPLSKGFPFLLAVLLLFFCQPGTCFSHRVTLLIPSKTSIEQEALPVVDSRDKQPAAKDEAKAAAAEQDKAAGKGKRKAGKKRDEAEGSQSQPTSNPVQLTEQVNASILASVAPQVIKEEADLLMSGMDPVRYQGISMDPPRLFTIYRFDKSMENPDEPASREDRLGDLEEIRYLDQKAMGANVGFMRPGLHQFTIETQPWWEQTESGYAQHIVKVMLPVYGQDWGWHLPLNLQFEIVPNIRPFGLSAPALFSGRVLAGGKPCADAAVSVVRINTEKQPVPTKWHESAALRTDANGTFSVILNKPGWWCCMATRQGAPLKGPDGQSAPLALSTLFWLYVDAAR